MGDVMFKKVVASIAAVTLTLALALPAGATKFKDVPSTHSLATEISYLSNAGVINGYADGTFKPNALLTKKHIAAMLVKALNLPTTNLRDPGYRDVPKTHQYYTEIAAAYTAGLFEASSNFKPESNISRAYMADILTKAFQLKSIAHNAVTYTDVPSTSAQYRAIQLVTMNNIAKGYEQKNYTHTFEPNKLLTRAHFAAFLARAMSLQSGTVMQYVPNKNYTYYFATKDQYLKMTYEGQDAGGEAGIYSVWDIYDDRTGAYYGYLNYTEDWTGISYFSNAVIENTVVLINLPVTIGLKYSLTPTSQNVFEQISQKILDTKATVKIAGKTYTNVIVVEEVFGTSWKNAQKRTTYITKDYGVIGIKNHQGYWRFWLDKRIAN